MAASDNKPQDPKEEVAQLKAQLDALSDPVQPAATAAKAAIADKAAGVADQATEYAKQAYATVNERTDWLADRTRQAPILTLGIACAVGYVLGRIVR